MRRCTLPALPEGGSELSVNLDAVGRLGALLCQIAALEPGARMAWGAPCSMVRKAGFEGLRLRDKSFK